jgi:hypothetical protein
LVGCSIPGRLSGLVGLRSWQANINDMLRSVPIVSTFTDNNDEYDDDIHDHEHDDELDSCFDAIDATLTASYENLL